MALSVTRNSAMPDRRRRVDILRKDANGESCAVLMNSSVSLRRKDTEMSYMFNRFIEIPVTLDSFWGYLRACRIGAARPCLAQ